jgi:hypothetical protein
MVLLRPPAHAHGPPGLENECTRAEPAERRGRVGGQRVQKRVLWAVRGGVCSGVVLGAVGNVDPREEACEETLERGAWEEERGEEHERGVHANNGRVAREGKESCGCVRWRWRHRGMVVEDKPRSMKRSPKRRRWEKDKRGWANSGPPEAGKESEGNRFLPDVDGLDEHARYTMTRYNALTIIKRLRMYSLRHKNLSTLHHR